jgi:hypothetical protein
MQVILVIASNLVFFTTFEVVKHFLLKWQDKDDLSFLEGFIGGGLAGLMSISASYPQVLLNQLNFNNRI